VETEKRDQVLNVGNARQQKSYIGSFGYSDNNDNSPQIYEAVEISNIREHKYDLDNP
jgi:hypothetical protein